MEIRVKETPPNKNLVVLMVKVPIFPTLAFCATNATPHTRAARIKNTIPLTFFTSLLNKNFILSFYAASDN